MTYFNRKFTVAFEMSTYDWNITLLNFIELLIQSQTKSDGSSKRNIVNNSTYKTLETDIFFQYLKLSNELSSFSNFCYLNVYSILPAISRLKPNVHLSQVFWFLRIQTLHINLVVTVKPADWLWNWLIFEWKVSKSMSR